MQGKLLIAVALGAALSLFSLPSRSQRPEPHVTIAATGDLLLHIKVGRSARAHSEGWARVFRGLRESFRADDIAFANLETPLVDDVRAVATGTPPTLGAPPLVAKALAEAGLDLLGCANNHAYDQSSSGLRRTLIAIEEAGMISVGAGPDRPSALSHRLVERGSSRTAFLSYTAGMNRGAGRREPVAFVAHLGNEAALEGAIEAARLDADFVVLAVHWGHDFQQRPNARQRRLARRWVELGVDLILGTGPHILHRVEVLPSPRGQAIVAYSLGNAISNQGKRYRVGRTPPEGGHPALLLPGSRDGVVLRVALHAPRDGEVSLASLSAVPLWTQNNFWALQGGHSRRFDIRVARLDGLDEATRADRMPAIAEALGRAVHLSP